MHFTLTLQHWDPFLLPCNLLWTQIILFITLVTLICFHAFDTQHTTLWPMSTPCKLLLSIWCHLGFVCRWHSRRGARFRQEIILWYDKITRRKAIQDCKLYYDRWKFVQIGGWKQVNARQPSFSPKLDILPPFMTSI